MSLRPIHISTIMGGGRSDHLFTYYVYRLTLFYKNDTSVTIEETTNEKYINLFTFANNINFDLILAYELNITIISFNTLKFNIKNKFKVDEDIHLYRDNNVYIEITKNKDNNANCCIHITTEQARLFFTPPNY